MKNLDLLSKRIAVVSIGICGILLCVSLLVFSIGNVSKSYATETKLSYQNAPVVTAVAGEIMFDQFGTDASNIVFWNTATGKSVRYSFDAHFKKWVKVDEPYAFPQNPFE